MKHAQQISVCEFSEYVKMQVEAAVLAEREACAKVCEVVAGQNPDTALTCAAAIRARGEK